MIRLSITAAAFDAVDATLPLGNVGFERETGEKGEVWIWLERAVVDQASGRSRLIVVWLTPNVRAMSVSASPASRRAKASRR